MAFARFLPFGQRPIDTELEKRLRERGQTEKIKELQATERERILGVPEALKVREIGKRAARFIGGELAVPLAEQAFVPSFTRGLPLSERIKEPIKRVGAAVGEFIAKTPQDIVRGVAPGAITLFDILTGGVEKLARGEPQEIELRPEGFTQTLFLGPSKIESFTRQSEGFAKLLERGQEKIGIQKPKVDPLLAQRLREQGKLEELQKLEEETKPSFGEQLAGVGLAGLGFAAAFTGEKKGVTKVAIPEIIETAAKSKFGKTFLQLTKTERRALGGFKEPIIIEGEEALKQLVTPSFEKRVLTESKPELLYGGMGKGVFTDGYQAIIDPRAANEALSNLLAKQKVKEIKELVQRAGISHEEALRVVEKTTADRIAEMSPQFPNVASIVPSLDQSVSARVIGFIPSERTPTLILEGADGTQHAVNPDFFANLRKYLPDSNLRIVGNERTPIVFEKGGKVTGLLMPILEGGTISREARDAAKFAEIELGKTKQAVSKKTTKIEPEISVGQVAEEVPPPAVPPPDVPVSPGIPEGMKGVRFITSVKEAEAVAPEIKDLVEGYYTPITNAETYATAKQVVETNPDIALQKINSENPILNADYTATALALVFKARSEGKTVAEAAKDAAKIVNTVGPKLTQGGQFIQAASMIDKLSPEGVLFMAERQLRESVGVKKRLILDTAAKTIEKELKNVGVGVAAKPEKERILTKIFKQDKTKSQKDITDRIIELSEKGDFTDPEYKRLIAQKLGIPTLTDELARELIERAQIIQKMPYGYEKFKTTQEMLQVISRQIPRGTRGWIEEIANLPRTLMSSFFDLSFGFRQGLFVASSFPKQFGGAFSKQFKAFATEKGFEQLMDSVMKNPVFGIAEDAGLAFTELGSILTKREERFQSSLAEKIPLIGKGVRMTARAYTGMANKLRMDVFASMVQDAEKLGLSPRENKVLLQAIADFVNSGTGRGSIGKFEQAAPLLNAFFFSPRLMMSRLRLLNPVTYIRGEPFVRQQALKSLLTFAGSSATVLGLAKMAGVEVGIDPRSADFGKIKINNTRIDVMGGFQQYIRMAAQLISGKYVSSTTGKVVTLGEGYKPLTRLDILGRQIESKEAPIFSLLTDLLRGQDFGGQKISIPKEIGKRFIPMVAGDIYEVVKNDPDLLPLGALGIFGFGVQTYPPPEYLTKLREINNSSDPIAAFNNLKKENPKLADKVTEAKVQENYTEFDWGVRAMGVENGDRARFLVERFNSLDTTEEKALLWDELKNKKLISKEVGKQIKLLLNEQAAKEL